jgi:hypothetical protein
MKPVERRRTPRFNLGIRLGVSVLNATEPEARTESLNVSAGGVYFATNLPLRRGTGVQLLLKLPEEITHVAATDWVCMGHVVHVRHLGSPNGSLGVGVQFDCYEVAPAQESLASRAP